MTYSTIFQTSWTKPKKNTARARSQQQVLSPQSGIQPDETKPALDGRPVALKAQSENLGPEVTVPSAQSDLTTPSSTPKADEKSDLKTEVLKAGILIRDFAYNDSRQSQQLKEIPESTATSIATFRPKSAIQDSSVRTSSTATATSSSSSQLQEMDTDKSTSTVSKADYRRARYASTFPSQWSQSKRERELELEGESLDGSQKRERLAQVGVTKPPLQTANTTTLATSIAAPKPARYTTGHTVRRRYPDVAEGVSYPPDSRTQKYLSNQFSADDFLAYYRDRTPPAVQRQDRASNNSTYSSNSEGQRQSRNSDTSMGDAPPRYHQSTLRSDHSAFY